MELYDMACPSLSGAEHGDVMARQLMQDFLKPLSPATSTVQSTALRPSDTRNLCWAQATTK